ncbi:MAG: hypothetical protein HOW73_31620 [Polyangiaceae bacterium]|nr:hypothetical protein [Polyangiaceae bacterium]
MSPSQWRLLVLGVVAWSISPQAVFADESATVQTGATPGTARSIGSPNRGRLENGKKLEACETIHLIRKHRWGLPDLVGLIDRSAKRVADKYAGSVLVVGDLSQKAGGQIRGHGSHKTGRDADIGFYLLRGDKSFVASDFHIIDREGRAKGVKGVRFDTARNWALVESWLSDERATVLHIFVANHLRTRLLAEAQRVRAPAELIEKAAEAMVQPRPGARHDDHFHVRIRCPDGQSDCMNFPVRYTRIARPSPSKQKATKAQTGRAAKASKRPAAKIRPKRPK